MVEYHLYHFNVIIVLACYFKWILFLISKTVTMHLTFSDLSKHLRYLSDVYLLFI